MIRRWSRLTAALATAATAVGCGSGDAGTPRFTQQSSSASPSASPGIIVADAKTLVLQPNEEPGWQATSGSDNPFPASLTFWYTQYQAPNGPQLIYSAVGVLGDGNSALRELTVLTQSHTPTPVNLGEQGFNVKETVTVSTGQPADVCDVWWYRKNVVAYVLYRDKVGADVCATALTYAKQVDAHISAVVPPV